MRITAFYEGGARRVIRSNAVGRFNAVTSHIPLIIKYKLVSARACAHMQMGMIYACMEGVCCKHFLFVVYSST